MDEDADFCYSATGGREFDYYDDYGEAVETSLKELKESFKFTDQMVEELKKGASLANLEVDLKADAKTEEKKEKAQGVNAGKKTAEKPLTS